MVKKVAYDETNIQILDLFFKYVLSFFLSLDAREIIKQRISQSL